MTTERLFAYAALSVAALSWAGNFVLGRAIHPDISPMALTFWRWAVAAVLLAPFAVPVMLRHRVGLLAIRRQLLVMAVTGICLFHLAVYTALKTTTATNAALMAATVPVVMPVFSWIINRDTLMWRQALGIAISLFGVVMVLLKGAPATILSMAVTPGDLWMLFVAVPVWALYTVLVRRLPSDLPPLASLMAIMLMGLVINACVYVVDVTHAATISFTTTNVLAIGYVAVFASVVAYVCWNKGVAAVGPNVAGLFSHLMPVFSAGLAILLLGERLEPYHGVGATLVALGIFMTATARRSMAKARSRER